MSLALTASPGCLYLLQIKENPAFITKTERLCLPSRAPHWGAAAAYLHHTYLIGLLQGPTPPHVSKPLLSTADKWRLTFNLPERKFY